MAMIAINAHRGINAISVAEATQLIGDIAAAAGTAMSIVTIDQIERSVGLGAETGGAGVS
ncbi:hypothetical protein IP69_19695 [Bosea sp. AAP35]|nr:hypothetical protein IP69_19695 [Bosea sp. AAP35]